MSDNYCSNADNKFRTKTAVDVLCAGHACFDLVFAVEHHPQSDEKLFAENLSSCGGGPAANAAVQVARLGQSSALASYLGRDDFGEIHLQELIQEGVVTDLIVRGEQPTPLSAILVKPDGQRTVVNYKSKASVISENGIDFSLIHPKVILFDGHEPELSKPLLRLAAEDTIPTVLDAGSVHRGTEELVTQVDYLIASQKFALNYSGQASLTEALKQLSALAPAVVITAGEDGLLWSKGDRSGELPALKVDAVDSTAAGDAFHGAFAAGLAANKNWEDLLKFASAAGAYCCTCFGGRSGLPTEKQLLKLLKSNY